MNKKILISASILGMLAVILGAFAAHGLENKVTEDAIETFQTGVRYQMYHALLLLFVAQTSYLRMNVKKVILYLVIAGVLLFSGSIYGLATNVLTSFDFKSIAFITPIGGLLLILSWIVMLIGFVKNKEE
ncbi:DUF423 domain-containing protein [Flavobacteriaceae bacterium S0825]|uniref:DUF423 domain-containing protein n=1 Tax=Gaetbulibacter sp. S0825 TaxID=2720084 RepID=UPI001430422C|nr:DUF423 domain-containing protein [Gaetbulibacter sp. S0825]MCK0107953.1 DUF423 domain-containing protein [Flavobacteriaceae bacterium S0825]NIX63589.1 DUF423 domain-containing protein [Gaetbulibacter sp. S0825]